MYKFEENQLFPPLQDVNRLNTYRENEVMFQSDYEEMARKFYGKTDVRISINLAKLIVEKSADFLVGSGIQVRSNQAQQTKTQGALERIKNDNNMDTLAYELAAELALKGDAFVKVWFGRDYDNDYSEKKVHIELLETESVYPVTSIRDKRKIVAYYHTTIMSHGDQHYLVVDYHEPRRITSRAFELHARKKDFLTTDRFYGKIESWNIGKQIGKESVVETKVDRPLIVHFKNPMPQGGTWRGIDDIATVKDIIAEINNRFSQISRILDAHADPMLALPTGLIEEDEFGVQKVVNPLEIKTVEVDKDDPLPQYITNNSPAVREALEEIEVLWDKALILAEIPALLLGAGNQGTSGSSGAAIDSRTNATYNKSERKRKFFNSAMQEVYLIAQELENVVNYDTYEIVRPQLKFDDGIRQTRESKLSTIERELNMGITSGTDAIMHYHDISEEQAIIKWREIQAEKRADVAAVRTINDGFGELQMSFNTKMQADEFNDFVADGGF